MLGALISFIGFVLAICWWALAKQFRKYRKGEAPMSIVQFVLYCVLSFIVLGFVLSVIFAVIPEFMPRSYKHQLENNPEIMFGIVFIPKLNFYWLIIFLIRQFHILFRKNCE